MSRLFDEFWLSLTGDEQRAYVDAQPDYSEGAGEEGDASDPEPPPPRSPTAPFVAWDAEFDDSIPF